MAVKSYRSSGDLSSNIRSPNSTCSDQNWTSNWATALFQELLLHSPMSLATVAYDGKLPNISAVVAAVGFIRREQSIKSRPSLP